MARTQQLIILTVVCGCVGILYPAIGFAEDCSGPEDCYYDNACVYAYCDPVQGCIYTPVNVSDGNPCTDDSCNPATGAVYVINDANNCYDGDPCTTDHCDNGACVGVAGGPPAEIRYLFMHVNSLITWQQSGDPNVHDVVRGLLSELPVGSGASEFCVDVGEPYYFTTDSSVPDADTAFWYLVRQRNTCTGIGTYGFASNGSERVPNACP